MSTYVWPITLSGNVSNYLYIASKQNLHIMKKLLLLTVLGILIFGCSKSSDNDPDPDPTPTDKYKVTYNFTSIGIDTVDFIKYLDSEKKEVILTDTSEFSLSFEQPSNNVHGSITIKGTTGTLWTGFASYSMIVTDKNNDVVYLKEGETNSTETNFQWSAEYKNIETK